MNKINKNKNKERKRSLGKPNTLKIINVFVDQLRQGQPNSTEQVEVQRNTNYQMGQPNVKVLEEGKTNLWVNPIQMKK